LVCRADPDDAHWRGIETAQTVCAVSDGTERIQGFVDLHRPDAVQILDFPHALGYVAQAGQAVYGEGTEVFTQWFTTQRQALRHGDTGEVVRTLQRLVAPAKRRGAEHAMATVQASVAYLEKRRAMLDYAWFDAQGYPLGSGSVESANKLVVERRLKRAGMLWARPHVNPMVALRTIACSDRWQEAWPQIAHRWWQQVWQCQVRRKKTCRQPEPAPPAVSPLPATPKTPKTPFRPPADHPWRRFRVGRASSQPPVAACVAKL
jgi:hypothetical protein